MRRTRKRVFVQTMPLVISLEGVQLRVGVQNILNRHHILKAIRTTHRRIILRPTREYLLVLVLGEEGAHWRVRE